MSKRRQKQQQQQSEKQARQQKTERNKLSGLPPEALNELRRDKRDRDAHALLARQKEASRLELPTDFLSALLVRWSLAQLLMGSKLLLRLLNRNRVAAPGERRVPLVHLSQPAQYRETLWTDYAVIEFTDEQWMQRGEEVWDAERGAVLHRLVFRDYYNAVYRAAKQAHTERGSAMETGERRHHITLLCACFLIALVKDERIARFALRRHDYHYKRMHTTPPSESQVRGFIDAVHGAVDDFLAHHITIDVMCDYCVEVWQQSFMFREVEQ